MPILYILAFKTLQSDFLIIRVLVPIPLKLFLSASVQRKPLPSRLDHQMLFYKYWIRAVPFYFPYTISVTN